MKKRNLDRENIICIGFVVGINLLSLRNGISENEGEGTWYKMRLR